MLKLKYLLFLTLSFLVMACGDSNAKSADTTSNSNTSSSEGPGISNTFLSEDAPKGPIKIDQVRGLNYTITMQVNGVAVTTSATYNPEDRSMLGNKAVVPLIFSEDFSSLKIDHANPAISSRTYIKQ